jgi:hypothetical protein
MRGIVCMRSSGGFMRRRRTSSIDCTKSETICQHGSIPKPAKGLTGTAAQVEFIRQIIDFIDAIGAIAPWVIR